jgi:hypothetical protein
MRRSPFRRPSTLPHPPPAPRETKLQEKKRYETTVILVDHRAAVPAKTKKLKKWTDDFTDARNRLIRQGESNLSVRGARRDFQQDFFEGSSPGWQGSILTKNLEPRG